MRAVRDGFRNGAPTVGPMVGDAFVRRLHADMMIATYFAVGGEIDPAPLTDAALSRKCRIGLPHVVDTRTPLRFLKVDGRGLTVGPYGLSQPPSDAAEVAPDIIITPLVAFDRRGNRIGQGAGHYDRAFAHYPDAWRVGVAWSVQECETLPIDHWDVPLHAIATEKEWIVP